MQTVMESNVNTNMERTVDTICGFCGTGCGLSVTIENEKITKVKGDKNNPTNHGETCIKGSMGWGYVYSDKRLTGPLIRKSGELVPASWDEALDLIAERFGAIKEQYGPDAFGCFSSSRATNELNYLAAKFMRAVIGTNNIDSCNRT